MLAVILAKLRKEGGRSGRAMGISNREPQVSKRLSSMLSPLQSRCFPVWNCTCDSTLEDIQAPWSRTEWRRAFHTLIIEPGVGQPKMLAVFSFPRSVSTLQNERAGTSGDRHHLIIEGVVSCRGGRVASVTRDGAARARLAARTGRGQAWASIRRGR
jgi:hypothetical protein